MNLLKKCWNTLLIPINYFNIKFCDPEANIRTFIAVFQDFFAFEKLTQETKITSYGKAAAIFFHDDFSREQNCWTKMGEEKSVHN